MFLGKFSYFLIFCTIRPCYQLATGPSFTQAILSFTSSCYGLSETLSLCTLELQLNDLLNAVLAQDYWNANAQIIFAILALEQYAARNQLLAIGNDGLN